MCTYKYINIYIVYTYMEYCTRVPWMTEQIRKKRNKEKKKKEKKTNCQLRKWEFYTDN